MQLVIRNRFVRRLLVALEVVAFLLATGWIGKSYVAQFLASKISIENLKLATKLDPNKAEYHLQLGRLYEFVLPDIDPQKAVKEFRRARELSPHDPNAWLNLAAAAEFQGRTSEAEKHLRQADSLAPHLPVYQWPIGNFFLLHGNNAEAFRHFSVVLAGTRQYDQIIFGTAWKASGDPQAILNQLIPQDLPAEFSYLYYLVSAQRLDDTRPVWERILSSPGRFPPQQVSAYIDSLINARRPREAFQVWTELQKKGLVRFPLGRPGEDLITNGDFEDELINMGFAWRIIAAQDVYAGLDNSVYHSPGHSLLVQFPGKQNFDYGNVLQYVKVAPGRNYRLRAFLRTEGITTDSGPRLEVRDANDPRALDILSENLTGSTGGWTSVQVDFKTDPKTELIVVALRRLPSQKFDNLISGKAWLDDVRLTPVQ